MKKLGLIGGVGPESTIVYYHDIIAGVQQRAGSTVLPELSIESIDMYHMLQMCAREQYAELTQYLLSGIKKLAGSGADFAAICSNTPHIVFDRLQEESPIPLVSIIEAAGEEAVQRKLDKIGLFGTIFTMKGTFFKQPFEQKGIQVLTASEEEMIFINKRIAEELEYGIVKQETLAAFVKIIQKMKEEQGIQALALGCTELPLLLNDENCPVPCLDTMKIHIQALINKILEA